MKIIRKSQRVTNITHRLCFDRIDDPGAGFMFDCDEYGNVDVAALNPTAQGSWKMAQDRSVYSEPYVQEFRNSYTEPAIGICNRCGREVVLSGFTNTCECGLDYNWNGSQLAPRSCWGEETGETAADILMGGDPWE